MEYAVIRTGGKQYRVTKGDVISVEKLKTEGKTHIFSDVLMHVSDGTVTLGKPVVKGLTVTAEVLGDIRGEKIRVGKFKSKVRHRRVTGHRQHLTSLKIEDISKK